MLAEGLNWSYNAKSQLESNNEMASESDKYQIHQVPKFEKLEVGNNVIPIRRKQEEIPSLFQENGCLNLNHSMTSLILLLSLILIL